MSVTIVVGGSGTYSSASGGKIFAFNNIQSGAPTIVAQQNVTRQKITFHNPGSIDIYVAPTLQSNPVTGAQTPLTPALSALGGSFLIYANGATLTVSGECQGAWQALSASGSNNSLTVMDSNLP